MTSDAVIFNEPEVCCENDESGYEFSFTMLFKMTFREGVVINNYPSPSGSGQLAGRSGVDELKGGLEMFLLTYDVKSEMPGIEPLQPVQPPTQP